MLKHLFKEGLTHFGMIFLLIGILLQVITFVITRDSILSLICGTAGVFSVVMCSEKKISMYAFGFVQLFTYVALCLQQHLYGEIAENVFYLVTMVIGIILWSKHYNNEENEVISKEIKKEYWLPLIIGTILISLGLGKILGLTNDTRPYLDAFSTVPAFVAQILMMLRYREQWFCWLVVDILTCILWVQIENWCMVAQYVFWTFNCLYGLKNWKNA